MPEKYTRSRGRLYKNYPANQEDGYEQEGNGGGYAPQRGRRFKPNIVVIVAAVVVVCVVGFLLRNAIVSAFGGGASPTDTPLPTTMATDTVVPTDTSDAESSDLPTDTPADSLQPDDSASPDPADSSQPDDSASPDPTDSSQPDDSASPDPTDTTQPNASATPGGTDNTAAITPKAITGKANVANYLPLKSTASSSATTLVKIKKDETFTIEQVSTSPTWLKVKYSDKTGYVLASYVTIESDSHYKVCTIKSATINVRSGAGTTHNIIGTLKSGDTVVVTEHVSSSGKTWYKIIAGDSTGYIDSTLCRASS